MGRRPNIQQDGVPASPDIPIKRNRRARSLEKREDQLIALAYDLVEQRMRNGTATSQETVEFLRRGSTKARLEKEIMQEQVKLTKAKTEAYESAKRIEASYAEAMEAFRSYQGTPGEKDEVL